VCGVERFGGGVVVGDGKFDVRYAIHRSGIVGRGLQSACPMPVPQWADATRGNACADSGVKSKVVVLFATPA
jgi:hypothetical protein